MRVRSRVRGERRGSGQIQNGSGEIVVDRKKEGVKGRRVKSRVHGVANTVAIAVHIGKFERGYVHVARVHKARVSSRVVDSRGLSLSHVSTIASRDRRSLDSNSAETIALRAPLYRESLMITLSSLNSRAPKTLYFDLHDHSVCILLINTN